MWARSSVQTAHARTRSEIHVEGSDFESLMNQREVIVGEILDRGVIVGVLPDKESFRQRLLSLEPMRIYIGADPTSTALHLSHAKNYMLLEEFRRLGHEVIVLFGDFTARIGDPTNRLSARKQLTAEEVAENAEGWLRQIEPLMNLRAAVNPPRILYNSEWLAPLSLADVVELAANSTVQRMLERDMFEKRIRENHPIHLHEFLYPLMQGYDSVAMDVDAELCGTDQTFNALMGRTLLKRYKNKDKFVVTVNLMENPVTGELMSKSKGTGIFLDFTPFDMFGGIMSQPDEMIRVFLINNTRVPLSEIDRILSAPNPRDAKLRAAYEVCRFFHDEAAAADAQQKFASLVQRKDTAVEIPEMHLGATNASLYEVVKRCIGDELSNSEIRRMIQQRAVKVDGVANDDTETTIAVPPEGVVVRLGKKKWFRVLP